MFSRPLPRVPKAVLAALPLLLAGFLGSCTEGQAPTDLPEEPLARLALNPVFNAALTTEGSAPINRIRITATLEGTDSILGQIVLDVDPNAQDWTVDVDVLVPTGPDPRVVLSIELINVTGGVETVEWSGRTPPFTVAAGSIREVTNVGIVRGPLGNLTVTALSIQEPIPDVREGESTQLTANVTNTDPQSTSEVFWASLDPAVAAVSSAGLLTGVSPGTARMVATAGVAADTATATVFPMPVGVRLEPDTALLQSLGAQAQFSGEVVDVRGDPVPGESVIWGLESSEILLDLGNGLYEALSRGTTVVTATSVNDAALTASAVVIVEQAVDAVEVTPETILVETQGDVAQFQAQAFDANGNVVEGMAFIWSTSNEAVATIDQTGLASAVDNGTVTVYAEAVSSVATLSSGPSPVPMPGTIGEATLIVNLQLDLELEKFVSDSSPSEGETIVYTVVLTNHGAADATNVVVVDQLPEGVTFVSYQTTQGSYDSATGHWTVSNQPNGQSDTLSITATVDSGTVGTTITNQATITSLDQVDNNASNDIARASVIPAGVDISVEKTVDDPRPAEDIQITYTVEVANLGDVEATGVEVSDLIPTGVTYGSHTVTSGAYDPALGVWAIPAQSPGEADTLLISVTVDHGTVGTDITNTATLTHTDQTDTNPDNDTDDVTITPKGVDISVGKTVDNSSPGEGDQVVYTLVVANAGVVEATNVEVTDLLPAGVTYVSHTATSGTYDLETGLWTIPSQPPAQVDTLLITVTVDIGTAGIDITNRASLTAVDQTDGGTADDTGQVTITPEGVNISVSKDVDKYSPTEGEQVEFMVEATNFGQVDATGVQVTDLLPAGLTFVRASMDPAGGYDTRTGLWSIGTLAPSASANLILTATVDVGTVGTPITNQAALTAVDQTDTDASNDTDQVTLTPVGVDLAVTKTVSVPEAEEGDIVTYTIQVANQDPGTATGVTLSEDIPAELVYSSHTVTAGSYDRATGIWDLTGVPLASGSVNTLTLDVTVGAETTGQSFTNVAQVETVDQTDSDPSNDSDTADLLIVGTDLQVTKTVDKAVAIEGDTLTYTVQVTNLSTLDATGVQIQDDLTGGVTFLAATPTSGTYDAPTGLWDVGGVAAGATHTLTLLVTVNQGALGQTIQNTASVSAVDQVDTDPANDSEVVSTTIEGPDISLTKEVDTAFPGETETITYRVIATNLGPQRATDVVIQDVLPAQVTYVSHTPSSGTFDSGTGDWSLPEVPAGQVDTLLITVQVNAGTFAQTVTNTATLTQIYQTDGNPSDNSAPVSFDVYGADLEVQKIVDVTTAQEGNPLVFTITVTNNGFSNATGVQLADTLPTGVVFSEVMGVTQGSYDSVTEIWDVGTLASGQSATLTIEAVVGAGALDPIQNITKVVALAQTDSVPWNNADTTTTDFARPPVADDKSVTTDDETPVLITLTGSDPDGDPLTFAVTTPPSNGTLGAITPTGPTSAEVTYTPTPGSVGPDSFQYGANDGVLDSPAATVSIQVNDVPQPSAYTTPGNTEIITGAYPAPTTTHIVDPNNVLANTPTLAVTSTGTFASTNGGTVIMEADGDFSFTPAPGDSGSDTFDYTVNTGATATVTITMEDMVWYVDNSSPTLPGTGVSNDPFETLAEAEAVTWPSEVTPGADAVPGYDTGSLTPPDGPQPVAPMPERVIFLFQGNSSGASPYPSTLKLDTNIRFQGEGAGLSLGSFPNLVAVGGTPVITSASSDAVALGSGTIVRGIDIQNPVGAGIYAGGINGATVDQVSILGTVAMGISLNNSTGTLSFTNVTVTDSDNNALYISGGDPTVNFTGSLVQNAVNPHLGFITVQNTSGGSVTLGGGPFTDDGS
ncbi:Ig-like domain-containing protein, partial [Gemmatimonadota bacterium]